MIKNRYFKTTAGVPFELIIGASLASTAYTDFPTFQTTATVLEIAAFSDGYAQTGTVKPIGVQWNTAAPTNIKKSPLFFSTLESRDSATKLRVDTSTSLNWATVNATLIPYAAPTFEVATIVRTGSTWSALQELVFKIVETTPGSEPLPTWDYIYNPAGAEGTAWQTIANQINLGREEEFFTAAVSAYVAPVIGAATLVATVVTAVAVTTAGSGLFTTALPNGTGTIPLIFTGGGGTGAIGVLNIKNGIATGTTITAGGTGYTSVPTVTIAAQTALTGLTITSLDASRHFVLVGQMQPTTSDTVDYGPTFTSTIITQASEGSGTVAHMLELQAEANVRRGIGHYYTDKVTTGTTATEFGLPVDVVTQSTVTSWDLISVVGVKTESSPTPVEQHQKKYYIFIAVPSGQGSKVMAIFS
jgi:hypothetical protein